MGRQPKAHPHRDDAAAKTAAAPLLPAWLAPNPDGGCTLAVHAKPGAKHCSIALGEEVLDVAIDAPSRDGEANAGIVEFLAEALGLKPRDLAVVAGGKSREKLVKVHGLVGAEVLRRLQEYVEPPGSALPQGARVPRARTQRSNGGELAPPNFARCLSGAAFAIFYF
jgi:hypothetical protein